MTVKDRVQKLLGAVVGWFKSWWPFGRHTGEPERPPETIPFRHFRGVATATRSDNYHSLVQAGYLVLLLGGGKAKWLYFTCPCGCEETVALNLMRSHFPHWQIVEVKDGIISVTPSVASTTCGSHYWIRENQVVLCENHPT